MEKVKRLKTKSGCLVSDFPELRLLTDTDLEKLGLGDAGTRRNLRSVGKDVIPHVRIGRCVKYRYLDVLEYIERSRVVSG